MGVEEAAVAMGCAEGTVRSLTAARPDGPLDTDRVLASARRRTRRRHANTIVAIASVVLLLVGVISVLPPREHAVTLDDPTMPFPLSRRHRLLSGVLG